VRWKPYDEMTRVEQKMFWAAREGAMLHELPMPEVDDAKSDGGARWPAELPKDCVEVLSRWFDEGLIGVASSSDDRKLTSSEARSILADYGSWSPTYSLTLTDIGEAALL
jgi:hypothetical protein